MTPSRGALFQLKAVSKAYRRGGETVEIFDAVDMEIERGEFMAVMGPSGSGKTTLLNLLGGVDLPDAGELWYEDVRIDRMSESQLAAWRARNVGFVFQYYNLLAMLSAARNVELPLLLTNLPAKTRRERVATALELVGLTDRASHHPAELSGGQQQRVAIARAIVADKPLILCDEPTGNLDRQASNEVLEILQLLNRDFGKTIVMVTHDPSAAKFAHRVSHLDKGRFVDSPEPAMIGEFRS